MRHALANHVDAPINDRRHVNSSNTLGPLECLLAHNLDVRYINLSHTRALFCRPLSHSIRRNERQRLPPSCQLMTLIGQTHSPFHSCAHIISGGRASCLLLLGPTVVIVSFVIAKVLSTTLAGYSLPVLSMRLYSYSHPSRTHDSPSTTPQRASFRVGQAPHEAGRPWPDRVASLR